MKKSWKEVLKQIWYYKISPQGLFKEMEIIMFPNNDFTFKDIDSGFDFNSCELFLKKHLTNHLNQICFPKTCWSLKKNSQPVWMVKWLQSREISVNTNTKGSYGVKYPVKLLKKHEKQ